MTAHHLGGSGGMLLQRISDTQRVLLVHFLTSKSTSVYAYSSQCMTMLKDRLPVWQNCLASPTFKGGKTHARGVKCPPLPP